MTVEELEYMIGMLQGEAEASESMTAAADLDMALMALRHYKRRKDSEDE